MEWSMYSLIILANLLLIVIYLPLSILYYCYIIEPNAKLPLFRIRRPIFFFLVLLILILNGLIRTGLSLLIYNNIIHQIVFDLVIYFSTYYSSITLCVRVFLLWYDLKSATKQYQYMLSQHLTSIDDIMEQETKPRLPAISPFGKKDRQTSFISSARTRQKHSNILGQYKPLLIIAYTISTIFYIICVILYFINPTLSNAVTVVFLFGTIAFYTMIMCSMWKCCCCCKPKFKSSLNDPWNLMLELWLLWACFICGFVGVGILQLRVPTDTQPVVHGSFAGLMITTQILIMFYCPYSILKRLKRPYKNEKRTKLKKILSKKKYFFAFVQHLVHELSIENLTFLVEVWQFKYEEKYGLTSMDRKDMKKAKLIQEKKKKWVQEIESSKLSIATPSSHSSPSPHSPSSDTDIAASRFNTALSSTSMSTFNEANKGMIHTFLEDLPWCDLPLSHVLSMNPDNKWIQCTEIYLKFIGWNLDYGINIGYDLMNEIQRNYHKLLQYKELNNNSPTVTVSSTTVCSSKRDSKDRRNSNESNENEIKNRRDSIDLEIQEIQDTIVNDEQFNKVMIDLFDCAMRDIIKNLNNSLRRFMETDTFKMLNG